MLRLIIVSFTVTGPGLGDTLTFTFSGSGSGHWGTQTFSNAAFTLTLFIPAADDIVRPPCCTAVRSTPAGTSGTVTVAGFRISGFGPNGNQAVYIDPAAATVGVWHFNLSDFLTIANPALSAWDLSTSVGPLTATTFAYPLAVDPGSGVGLAVTSVTNVSFIAQRASSGGIPTLISMNPAFGNSSVGVANAFQFTVADPAGAGDLQGMNVLFSISIRTRLATRIRAGYGSRGRTTHFRRTMRAIGRSRGSARVDQSSLAIIARPMHPALPQVRTGTNGR